MTALGYLHLSNNSLTDIEIEECKPFANSLKMIDLSFNQLKKINISLSFGNCNKLKKSNLSHNSIKIFYLDGHISNKSVSILDSKNNESKFSSVSAW